MELVYTALMLLDQISFLSAGGALLLGAFLVSRILARPRPLNDPTRLLGLLILVCALNAAHPALIRWTGLGALGSGAFFEPMQFLLAPLLAAYAWAAVQGRLDWRWSMVLHGLPFGLAVAASGWYSFQGTTPLAVSIWFWALLTLQMLAYLIPALHGFHRYQDGLTDVVSNLAPVDLDWLRRFFWVALGLSLLAALVLLLLFHELTPRVLGPGVSLALTGAIWVLGTRGLDQKLPPVEASGNRPLPTTSERPPLSPTEARRVRDELQRLFETEKPHLDPDLDLAMLVTKTGVVRNHLSYVINNELGVNFYDWVNGWRLREFRALAADPHRDRDKILTLAFDAGFNAKPTFNKVVLKLTGMTPSALRNQEIESRRTR